MRMYRASLSALVVVGLAASVLVAVTGPAVAVTSRDLAGTVICSGGRPLMGVWVESTNGGSRWATTYRVAGRANAAYFRTTVTTAVPSTGIRLHIGCGEIAGRWWSTNLTPTITVTGGRTLNTNCAEQAGRGQRCTWPPTGTPRPTYTTNRGVRGYCTWGAYEQWRSRTTHYPYFAGNAGNWANAATAGNWRVSTVPVRRSVMVIEPGRDGTGSFGHVRYVIDVRPLGSGLFDVRTIEMNGGRLIDPALGKTDRFGQYDTRWYRHQAYHRYIQQPL